ncbi:MAG: hypothetical protein HN919_06785 [Verrucomicrobia bacterium]|nr:hypothetical protein [Verrucomicrobiota bacterium]MBT7065989.1 hypothetical protein [Verrucomicrobiota bacterium]MBT7699293.1 hypothetical protein [Verrucomicrobiota bacterium]
MSRCCTIAVIADLHYGEPAGEGRHGDMGDILLHRAVARLNDLVHPDVTVLLGDILHDGTAPDAAAARIRIRDLLAQLHSPHIVLPGNHDGDVATFYRDFERPDEMVDIAGMRLLPFMDEDRPGYCAARSVSDLERFHRARDGFEGPIIALQHVPVFPDGALDCPYNHVNAAAIMEAMSATGVALSLSGHYHAGHPPLMAGPTTLAGAPALHVAPFELLIIRIDGDRIDVEPHALAVDPDLGLCDYHIHTEFGYCVQDSTLARAADLGCRLGLAGVGFAEHSGQLYYSADDYWSGRCHREGIDGITPSANRMAPYFEAGAALREPGVRVGLELDFDYQGRAVLLPRDRQRADFLLGSVHHLPSIDRGSTDAAEVVAEFLWMVDAIAAQGVDILAHPFRIIKRDGIELSRAILEHVVEALYRSRTAAEINCHMGGPPLDFIILCMDRGVKLALGGDAHHLLDVGNFAVHLELLKRAGAPRDLSEVLFRL